MLAKVDIKDIRYIESEIQKAYNAGYVLWEKAKGNPCQMNCQTACESGCQSTCQTSCQTACEKTIQCGSRQACGGQNPCGACEKSESSTS